jgi:small subunit ribosomal protein S6
MLTFAPSSEETRIYEALVLLPMDVAGPALTEEMANIEQLFAEKGGKPLYKEDWGRQGLAYPVKRHREGRFVLFVYELPPSAAPVLEAALRLERGVLRHLLVRVPEHYAFTTFTERMEQWRKEEEKHTQAEEAMREERLKQRIVRRAARVAPPPPETSTAPSAVEGAQLEAELGKLISDEDLHL